MMDPRDAVRSQSPQTTTFNVLFVCTGNTCRSPMAEAVARREVERRGWRHVRVASAGVAAEAGHAASPQAVAVVGRRGLDLTTHASRALTPELVQWADLVLAMGRSHLPAVHLLGGGEKVALLTEFAAGESATAASVPDPFGGEEADYEETLQELEQLVHSALDRLAPIVQP